MAKQMTKPLRRVSQLRVEASDIYTTMAPLFSQRLTKISHIQHMSNQQCSRLSVHHATCATTSTGHSYGLEKPGPYVYCLQCPAACCVVISSYSCWRRWGCDDVDAGQRSPVMTGVVPAVWPWLHSRQEESVSYRLHAPVPGMSYQDVSDSWHFL